MCLDVQPILDGERAGWGASTWVRDDDDEDVALAAAVSRHMTLLQLWQRILSDDGRVGNGRVGSLPGWSSNMN